MRYKKNKTYPLDQSPIFKLKTKKRLTELLGISKTQIEHLTHGDNLYTEWDEENDKGKVRHIENPCADLKRAQKKIAVYLSRITPPDFLFCPIKGRSYVTNAKSHVGQKNIRCLDIKSYFTTTSSRRVFWFFHRYMQCSEDVAGILTALSTLKGHLPTGSPLSPILSYFTHIDMWHNIAAAVREADCILTVYMDDVTVSGSHVPTWLMWKIRKEIRRCGLNYHKAKRYTGNFSEITGVIVKDGKLNLPNRAHLKKHLLRKELIMASSPAEKETITQKLRGCEAQTRLIARLNN